MAGCICPHCPPMPNACQRGGQTAMFLISTGPDPERAVPPTNEGARNGPRVAGACPSSPLCMHLGSGLREGRPGGSRDRAHTSVMGTPGKQRMGKGSPARGRWHGQHLWGSIGINQGAGPGRSWGKEAATWGEKGPTREGCADNWSSWRACVLKDGHRICASLHVKS